MRFRRYIINMLLLLAPLAMSAGKTTITAKLDSANVMMLIMDLEEQREEKAAA